MNRRRLLAAGASVAASAVAPRVVRAEGTPAAEGTPVAGAMRSVETIHGVVEVPANPQRIVAVNFVSVLALLDLGIVPVGITRYLQTLPEGLPSVEGVAIIENEDYEIDLEQVAALQPDFIVGADWLAPADQYIPYEQLSVIAPTAIFEWRQAAGNWPAEAAGVAAALGMEAQMTALREDYEAYAADIRETYAEQLAAFTWDLVSATPSNWYLYGPSSSHGQVAAAAGVQFGAAASQDEGYIEESLERFDLLAGTGVLMAPMPGEGGLDVLDDVPTFQALPAVRDGRTFATPYFFPSSYGLSVAFLGDVEAALQTLW